LDWQYSTSLAEGAAMVGEDIGAAEYSLPPLLL